MMDYQRPYKHFLFSLFVLYLAFPLCSFDALAQTAPSHPHFEAPSSAMWLGGYGTFQISDKWFWSGEFHYRRVGHEGTPLLGRMGQIYNRHGIQYLFSKNLSITAGGVLRLNFTPDPGNEDFKYLDLEPRIWHQYMFASPLANSMVYHRLRIEHRWKRSNLIGDEYSFYNRWRYMLAFKIPINKPKLQPGAFYLNPNVELIMQSGKKISDNPLEDLRLNPIVGYISSPRLSYSISMMYTLGQKDDFGFEYRSRWVLRLNAYLSLDFRSVQRRVPAVHFAD